MRILVDVWRCAFSGPGEWRRNRWGIICLGCSLAFSADVVRSNLIVFLGSVLCQGSASLLAEAEA